MWRESKDQLSWNTDKPSPTNAAFIPLTDKRSQAEAGDEAAMEHAIEDDAMAAEEEVDEAATDKDFRTMAKVKHMEN
jgi:hypothetical protein